VPAVIQPTEKDVRETAGSDFDWVKNEDDIVLRSQPETAIYFNPHGSLVIRQRNWPDDDAFVVINAESIDRFIDKLTDIIGIPSVGRPKR
jgi:hypothetical protein